MTPPEGARGSRVRTVLLAAAAAAVVVQCLVLYAPQAPGTAPFPNADKVVHATVFLVPALLGLAARLPRRAVVGALAVHAVLSEVVQGVLLPDRSGDPWDAVADLGGVGLAVLGWWLAGRRRA